MDAPAVRCVTRMWIFFDKTGRGRYGEGQFVPDSPKTTNVVVVHAASCGDHTGSRLLLKLLLKAGLGWPSPGSRRRLEIPDSASEPCLEQELEQEL